MAEISGAEDAPDSLPSKNEEDVRNSTNETRKFVGTSAAAGDVLDSSLPTDENDAGNSRGQTRKPPLISLAMLRRAIGDEITKLDVDQVSHRVYAGVLLKDIKKQGEAEIGKHQEQPYTHKYWVDEDQNKSCWMVLAKALLIVSGHLSATEGWTEEKERCYSGEVNLPVAQVEFVPQLVIKGTCKTIMLSPRTMYEVMIVVKSSNAYYKRDVQVNLSLVLPSGNEQRRVERLDRLEKDRWEKEKDRLEKVRWIHISIGKFKTTPETVGDIRFSLTRTDWDRTLDLYVKGVVFLPTIENKLP